MAASLKPFAINLNDLAFLLAQVNFVPLFDGPANSNGIVNFDPATMDAWDAKGNQVWFSGTQSGSFNGVVLDGNNVDLLGTGFPHVSSFIGVRDPSGLHNNLFGTQAEWGAVDVPFRRDAGADFSNYVTSTGADYTTTADSFGVVTQSNVSDYMPRLITRTIVTADVNLLEDANGNFVDWDPALYASATPEGVTYAALIDGSGVDIATLVEGAKIVAPLGSTISWDPVVYVSSYLYNQALEAQAPLTSTDGHLYGSATGGAPVDGQPLYVFVPLLNTYVPLDLNGVPVAFNLVLYSYAGVADQSGAALPSLATGDPIAIDPNALVDVGDVPAADLAALLTANSGYGMLEQLGHIDFQNPDSGEYFIGSENPGVAPVNSWFGIFGQFFDHGLDLIGKGGQGTKITIQLATDDPLYRAPGTNSASDPGVTSITVNRASVAGADANGDPNYINHTSPFIDQSQTYGSVDQITQLLRKWVSTDGGATHHAGIELYDGQTLVDSWTRRWPDGTETEVHDTLPTLNELRQHVIDTGRAPLTWEDVLDYRQRDDAGQLLDTDANTPGVQTSGSGHALILDMNPHFDGATGPGQGHITQASLDKLSIAQGGAAGDIPAASFNIGMIMPFLNPDFSINTTDPALHEAVSDILMDSVGDHYIAGDGRVNENFGLTSIHHVFHEEHNFQVENLKTWIYAHDANNPGTADIHEQLHAWQIDTGTQDANGNFLSADGSIAWEPDKMFGATKLIVEMEYQHAAVDQYARTITPRIQEFVGYSTGVDATISLEYAQVAFRFGHSTIRETIDTVDPSGWLLGNVTRYALEKAFLAPQTFAEEGVAAITLGLSRQQMNEVDEYITPGLNHGLLDQPLDLAAINIARGRDVGIPTLNDMRAALSLAEYTSWTDFGAGMFHPGSLVNFMAAYAFPDPSGAAGGIELSRAKAQYILDLAAGLTPAVNPFGTAITQAEAVAFMANQAIPGNAELDAGRTGFDHIDSWIGGIAEAHVPGGLLGETFDAVFVAQIQSLMDGDRFYYLYRLFGTQIHEEVNNGQFKDIVERNTGLEHLNGSIFAYADKYYDFNRNADALLPDGSAVLATDNLDEHFYATTLAANPTRGIYSDGGADTSQNGNLISLVASDYVRPAVTLDLINDARPELDPTQVHPLEGTPTSGADSHEVIVATDNADFIRGRAGDDTIYGEDGDDFLYGDGGIDRLYGGAGNDLLDSGEGPDLVDGGAGKDIIYGRGSGSEVGGFDQLVGGTGNDLIIGGEGIDKLSGGSGDDIIYGDGLTNPEMGNTDAFTHGGDGNDYIDTGASGDLLYGEEGDDYMVGGIDQDLMQGGQGDDILRPGSPSQAINGGPDEVIGDDGFTNSGFDLIDFSDYAANAPGVVADMVTQFNPLIAIDAITPFPTWFQIEGVIGSSNDDTFIGTDALNPAEQPNPFGGSNWLIGGSGSDGFEGVGGNDLIVGGSIRLDTLIGSYAGADFGNLTLGSTEWLQDAMQTGGTGTGYDNNIEDAYTGASNRAEGPLGEGLLANATLGTEMFDKHFTEMLRSRMFKDVVLGDGGDDSASTDTATFTGNQSEYTIEVIDFVGASGEAVQALKITDNGGLIDNGEGVLVARAEDGIDLLVGVEFMQFADGLVSTQNTAPTDIQWSARTPGNTSLPGNNAIIADLSATDPGSISATYQILPGSSAGFQVTGDSIRKTGGGMSSNQTYNLDIRVTDDGGATYDETFTIRTGSNGGNTLDQSASSNDVILYGDDGNDTLAGGSGNDSLFGQDENDDLIGGGGNDLLHGGANDTDTAIYSGPVANYGFAQAAGGAVIVTDTVGSEGTDTLIDIEQVQFGTSTYDLVTGNNSINGSNGGDVIVGNDNNNTIDTNRGDDIVLAGAGDDTIEWNVTNPFFIFPELRDGHDIVDGGANTATGDRYVVNGNNTAETFRVYARAEALLAGIVGLAATTEIVITRNGTTDNDVIAELTGIEEITINTSGGNDTVLTIGNFNPTQLNFNTITVNGSGGSDIVDISGLSSQHRIVFNTGGDGELIGDPRIQDVVNVSAASPQSDRADPAKVVQGSGATDRMSGTAANERFLAGSNDDRVWGGAGNDDILGGNGADRLFGGTGSDKIVGGNGADLISGNSGNDLLYGGAGNDAIWGQTGDDWIAGGTGQDRLSGQNGNDTIYGGANNDTISGGAGNDMISGGTGADTISGDAGDDLLAGGSEADTIDGGAGNDRILASLADGEGDSYDGGADIDTLDLSALNSGATVDLELGTLTSLDTGTDQFANIENVVGSSSGDTIIANAAVNVFFGGAGADNFVFQSAASADLDQITDFQAGDQIDLSGMNGGQGLSLMAGPTFNAAGQVMFHHETDANGVEHTIVEGNVDNDNGVDFTIDILGTHNLTSSDFVGVA